GGVHRRRGQRRSVGAGSGEYRADAGERRLQRDFARELRGDYLSRFGEGGAGGGGVAADGGRFARTGADRRYRSGAWSGRARGLGCRGGAFAQASGCAAERAGGNDGSRAGGAPLREISRDGQFFCMKKTVWLAVACVLAV